MCYSSCKSNAWKTYVLTLSHECMVFIICTPFLSAKAQKNVVFTMALRTDVFSVPSQIDFSAFDSIRFVWNHKWFGICNWSVSIHVLYQYICVWHELFTTKFKYLSVHRMYTSVTKPYSTIHECLHTLKGNILFKSMIVERILKSSHFGYNISQNRHRPYLIEIFLKLS